MAENPKNQNGSSNFDYPQPWWHIPENIKDAIPLKEAAKKLHLHCDTVRLQAIQGRIKGFKIGRYWYIILPK
ncbi:helix-turn-helix domain-containing protein [Nostoc sp. PA-18-2419]|uniref:helix-turn-helix domain-containing protein n=1 Tax=Nostoc sp. PA-18-2419 TaxID=2575443 RepID=UPI001107BB52|nr:helix-turn-helix domain-containing protein [Nostoc sp. PA-18-2419]